MYNKRHGFFGNKLLRNFPSYYPWLQYKDTASHAYCLLHVSRVQPLLQYRATARNYIYADFSEFILHIERNLIGCNKARTLDLCPALFANSSFIEPILLAPLAGLMHSSERTYDHSIHQRISIVFTTRIGPTVVLLFNIGRVFVLAPGCAAGWNFSLNSVGNCLLYNLQNAAQFSNCCAVIEVRNNACFYLTNFKLWSVLYLCRLPLICKSRSKYFSFRQLFSK